MSLTVALQTRSAAAPVARNHARETELVTARRFRHKAKADLGVEPKADAEPKILTTQVSDENYALLQSEFHRAMENYKQASGRLFPTWSEALEVLLSLGYTKAGSEQSAVNDPLPIAAAPEPGLNRTTTASGPA